MASLPLPQIEGKYEILEKISEGGMGAVYKVRHLLLDEIRVVKVIKPQMADSADMRQRFQQEAIAATRLKHPNIAQLHDFAVNDDGSAYMVMEFIDGVNLQEMLRRHGPPPLDLTLEIARQGLRALAYLHQQGYVHRDIAPDNLMLSKDVDGRPLVKLIDLGIVKHLERRGDEHTGEGLFLGKVRYSSPEQFAGKDTLDSRSDLYSFGVMLYELLTGTCPIVGADLSQLVGAHLFRPALSFETTDPTGRVPREVREIVLRALEKDPANRIASADEFLELLSQPSMSETASFDLEQTLSTIDIRATEPHTPGPGSTQDRLEADFGTVGAPRPAPRLLDRLRGLRARRPIVAKDQADLVRDLVTTARRLAEERRWTDSRHQLFKALAIDPRSDDARAVLASVERSLQSDSEGERRNQGGRTVIGAGPSATELRSLAELQVASAPPSPPDGTVLLSLGAGGAGGGGLKLAIAVTRARDPALVGSRIPIARLPFAIGRAPDQDLPIDDPGLSRSHCEIRIVGGTFLVTDLGSANGVYVSGRRVRGGPAPLTFGDTLRLSDDTVLSFVADVKPLQDLQGVLVEGRYRLKALISASVKAATYVAEDEKPRKFAVGARRVAIKLFSPELAAFSHFEETFHRQAEMAAALHHPSICRILESGVAKLEGVERGTGVPFVLMDLLEGGSLRTRLEGPRPEIGEVLGWVETIAGALDYAHTCGVVHASLKPNSVVYDDEGRPYLTDFSTAVPAGSTADGALLGAPAFLAPEQWGDAGAETGNELTAKTDQYALAVLAYLLLTGTRPHESQEDPLVRRKNLARPPIPAHQAAALNELRLPEAVSAVLEKGLSVRPADRFETAGAFVAALRTAVEGTSQANRARRVFISYRRVCSGMAANFIERELREKYGIDAYVDVMRQDGAIQFPEKIRRSMAKCDVFLCLLARETLVSVWVRQEIKFAKELGLPMIPIFQESWESLPHEDLGEESLQSLIGFDGVRLLDHQNVYIDEAMKKLADLVRGPASR